MYSGKAPSKKEYGEGIGNWFNTLIKVNNLEVRKKFFDIFLNAVENYYLDEFYIKNFHSLQNITLHSLKDKRQIYILGENGDGKTLLLQSIFLSLNKGFIEQIDDKEILSLKNEAKENTYSLSNILDSKEVINYDFNRIIAFGSLRDYIPTVEQSFFCETLFSNKYTLIHPKKLLLDFYNKRNAKEQISKMNLEILDRMLSVFLEKKVIISLNTDIVNFIINDEQFGYDELSAGFRSMICFLINLTYRFIQIQPEATKFQDFTGIVFIDEIEVHMHPKWEIKFPSKLNEWFPNIQFFITTHSPEIMLGASTLENVALYKFEKEEDGSINLNNLFPEDPDNPEKRINIFKNRRIDQILSSELFDTEAKTYSDNQIKLIDRKLKLLLKKELTPDEEKELFMLMKETGSIYENN
ncbi:MAG: ATP-binding protein [Leptospiraceae bacterium]|nr:ATP-binding protein [Leptospiraceae bacterium]